MIMEVNCLQYQQLVIEQGQMMLNIDYDIFQDKESVTEYKVYTRWVPHLVNVGYKDSTPCKCGGWAPHPVKWWNMVGIWLEYC